MCGEIVGCPLVAFSVLPVDRGRTSLTSCQFLGLAVLGFGSFWRQNGSSKKIKLEHGFRYEATNQRRRRGLLFETVRLVLTKVLWTLARTAVLVSIPNSTYSLSQYILSTCSHHSSAHAIIDHVGWKPQVKWIRVEERRESLWVPSGTGTATPQLHEQE
jgi:hypothetical protein